MADAADILLNLLQEEHAQARQSEDQRATITNLIIVIAGALQGFIVDKNFSQESFMLATFLCLLGILGVISTAKLYERYSLHMARVEGYEKKIETLCADAQIRIVLKESSGQHKQKFSSRLVKLRVNQVWNGLHVFIILLGIINMSIILT